MLGRDKRQNRLDLHPPCGSGRDHFTESKQGREPAGPWATPMKGFDIKHS